MTSYGNGYEGDDDEDVKRMRPVEGVDEGCFIGWEHTHGGAGRGRALPLVSVRFYTRQLGKDDSRQTRNSVQQQLDKGNVTPPWAFPTHPIPATDMTHPSISSAK